MGEITWLASYPKSGNTWLRILLTNYRQDSDEPADINRLDGGPIASSRLWFDEWAGLEASLLPPDLVERLRPEVYRLMAHHEPEPLLMKIHDAWHPVDTGEPLIPPDATAGAVYIVRNPLDVVPSFASHYGLSLDEAIARMNDPQWGRITADTIAREQLPVFMGSWSTHVASWVDAPQLRLCLVRYEDLLADPVAQFARVVEFLGWDTNTDRVERAVEHASFAQVQAQELRGGFRERPGFSAERFFRNGRSGAWRGQLTPAQVSAVTLAHGPMMARLGYLADCPEGAGAK